MAPYLAELGVSHLYLSPILQAAPGSMHGYDVVDHRAVSVDLGGRAGLDALAHAAHDHGLGILVDVVPNHMAIPEPEHLNAPVWDVLARGRQSAYAHWFDVDWELCDGRLGLPVLGDTVDAVLAAGELRLDSHDSHDSAPVIRYHDHVFPVAEGTGGADVATVLDQQHYVLASWRDKDAVLGYRRFFDVDSLIAVRVELDDVFDATHELLIELSTAGVVDGFRIDHPDGLADPEGYLDRLRDATDGGWVVVEKILEGDERLPSTWATAGTTGYDALSVIQTALTPPTGGLLDSLWRDLAGDETLADVEHAAKRQVVTTLLRPEVERLTRLASDLSDVQGTIATTASDSVREAFETLLSHVEVYRAYLRPGTPADRLSLHRLDTMLQQAIAERPDLADILRVLHDALVDVDTDDPSARDLVVRFQQVCGPAMAKGVEDTTFYRYNRMLALNEVGGDPGALDSPGPGRLHGWAEHQQRHHPFGMTTLSTHDTKRSEDVRARLLAIAGDPNTWRTTWDRVHARAGEHVVDSPTAYLLFQTLLGTWPIDEGRLTEYLVKAMREAKRHTTWSDPDEGYESRVLDLARACLADEHLTGLLDAALVDHAGQIRAVSLAAKLLQLTLPGVPDLYQGAEATVLSVVDPDNRRPVDYDDLRSRIARLAPRPDPDAVPAESNGSAGSDVKLWVTSRTLRLRREHPDLFGAGSTYRPLESSSHLLGFVREQAKAAVATIVQCPSRSREASLIDLPAGRWVDVLTGRAHRGGVQQAEELLAVLPVALLLREGGR